MASHSSLRLRGSRPVVGSSSSSSLRRADEAGAEVEPAPHAAGVGAHEAVAGVGEAELLEHDVGGAVGRLGGRGRTAGRPSPGSRGRSCAGSTAAYWPARPMSPAHLRRGGRRRRCRPPSACPTSGWMSVATTRMNVVLPGAVGAEDGEDLAGLGDEVEPVEGVDVAEVLGEAAGLDDRFHGGHSRPATGTVSTE